MNAERREVDPKNVARGFPALREWHPGTSLPHLNAGQIETWLVDLDRGLSPDDVEAAEPGPELDVLSADERARAARFIWARDRRRFARCRAALREILGGLLQERPRSVAFRAVGHGKPELDFEAMGVSGRDARSALRFNVSHSAGLGLIGVCRGHDLGVDLEHIKPMREVDRIVESFFSPAERAEFTVIPDHLKALAFFRGWTRKEAVLKGLGTGLAGLAAHYETGFGMTSLPGYFIPATPTPRVAEWQLWEAAPRIGFVATVAVRLAFPSDRAGVASVGAASGVACPGADAVHSTEDG